MSEKHLTSRICFLLIFMYIKISKNKLQV